MTPNAYKRKMDDVNNENDKVEENRKLSFICVGGSPPDGIKIRKPVRLELLPSSDEGTDDEEDTPEEDIFTSVPDRKKNWILQFAGTSGQMLIEDVIKGFYVIFLGPKFELPTNLSDIGKLRICMSK